jgi:predicted transcriptional regulator
MKPLSDERATPTQTSRVAEGKNLSVRLPKDVLDILVGIAKVDDVTMGEVIRTAIREYAERRTTQPEFEERVKATQRQLAALLPNLD